jgi:hypothetical protein
MDSVLQRKLHIFEFVFFLFEFGGVKNCFVVNLIYKYIFCICSVLHIYPRVRME